MKFAHLTSMVSYLAMAEQAERKFVSPKICKRRSPLDLVNGELTCTEKSCKVKCDNGFDLYGGTKTVRCKQYSKPGPEWPQQTIDWNKQAGQCKTCAELSLDRERFEVACDLMNKLGQKIHRCKVRCVNNADIWIGADRVKKMLITKCRCTRNDNDGQCHWRLGNDYVDREFSPKTLSKWNCGEMAATTSAPSTTTLPNIMPSDLVCPESAVNGNRKVRVTDADRIIGGFEVTPNSWPWVARLRVVMSQGVLLCGGTIISDTSILTTAQCCQHGTAIQAFVGDHLRSSADQNEHVFNAISVIVHPQFNPSSIEHDMCLIKMPPMNLADKNGAAPACLPSSGDHPLPDTVCWVAGWGKMAPGQGSLADALNAVDVKVISDATCKATNVGSIILSGSMFCAGWLEGGKDACHVSYSFCVVKSH